MYSLLGKYSDSNKERFNKGFIYSRNDDDLLEYAKDIFKSLEVINEIEVLDVTLEKDESSFLPIYSKVTDGTEKKYEFNKQVLQSRLNRLHYKIKITPNEQTAHDKILDEDDIDNNDDDSDDTCESINSSSVIKEGDIYINKMIDDCFYINEGVRYFLIYQVVDNSTYGTKQGISLKSLLMPITMAAKQPFIITSLFKNESFTNIPNYEIRLFNKQINPLLYLFGKYSFNSLISAKIFDDINKWDGYSDTTIIDNLNKFFGIDFEFSDDESKLMRAGRTVFRVKADRGSSSGCCISVDSEKLNSKDPATMAILGCLMNMKNETGKKKIIYTYDDLVSPKFWIEKLSVFFTSKNSDLFRKFEKVRTTLLSLDRLIDDGTRKLLPLSDEDKKDIFTVLRYLMVNFDELSKKDNYDLDNKRIRLFEYQLFSLRLYFSNQIYRVLNSPTRSLRVLSKMFTNLTPTYVIQQTVVSELLRYYNSTNEIDLYSCLLKYTMRGPQSISSSVSVYQRDLHPSYVGRLSLVASNASDPGLAGNMTPFVEIFDGGFFKKQEE